MSAESVTNPSRKGSVHLDCDAAVETSKAFLFTYVIFGNSAFLATLHAESCYCQPMNRQPARPDNESTVLPLTSFTWELPQINTVGLQLQNQK